MNRPRRRSADGAPLDPRRSPLAAAAAIELRGGWPSWRGSLDFWTRHDVPPELRLAAEPDPRRVLDLDPETHERHKAADEAFKAARFAWLREQTENPNPTHTGGT